MVAGILALLIKALFLIICLLVSCLFIILDVQAPGKKNPYMESLYWFLVYIFLKITCVSF
jgi:hypothetical protein